MPALNLNESIEGIKIKGNSRDPLRYKRDEKRNGKIFSLYKVEFDVFAKIEEELTEKTFLLYEDSGSLLNTDPVIPKPLTSVGETIDCDSANITTIEKINKIKRSLESNFTATHSANTWEFKKQTNVKVATPRQEIINALEKRKATQVMPMLPMVIVPPSPQKHGV